MMSKTSWMSAFGSCMPPALVGMPRMGASLLQETNHAGQAPISADHVKHTTRQCVALASTATLRQLHSPPHAIHEATNDALLHQPHLTRQAVLGSQRGVLRSTLVAA